jgi:hypothetical protein
MKPILKGLCVALLILLAGAELYSALAVTFDYPKAASWEHTICGFLFALPCALLVGLALLTWKKRKGPGFYVAASSLIFYAGFVCADDYHAPMEKADWIAVMVGIIICAIGIGAARFLMGKPTMRAIHSDLGR